MNIFSYLIPVILSFILSRLFYYIGQKFIYDENYLMHRYQKFTFSYLFYSLYEIITSKLHRISLAYTAINILASIIIWHFFKHKPITSLLEILLFHMLFCACYMDWKTLTIDGYFSTIILVVAIANLLISPNQFLYFFNFIVVTILVLTLGIFIIYTTFKKHTVVIGGADIELFFATILYFDGIYMTLYVFLSGLMGILTKIIELKIKIDKDIKPQFPFYPSMCLAFYITRILERYGCLNFVVII